MDQNFESVRFTLSGPTIYFTVCTTDGGGFIDKLAQFSAFYKLGRSLNYLYLHTPLQSTRSSSAAFDFVGLNAFLAKSVTPPPFRRFRYLDIGISHETIEKYDLSSFEKLQTYIRRCVSAATAQTADNFVVRMGLHKNSGRKTYPIIHNGCQDLPDETNLFDIYREARRLQPRASLFHTSKIKVLVHMRQGDTGVIETPWHTFISTWCLKPDEYLQELDSYEQLSKDHIEIEHFYQFMQAFQLRFNDELSIAFCSDGYKATFDGVFGNMEWKFNFDEKRVEILRQISQSYDEQKFRGFDQFHDSVLQVGESDEHFFDLINSMVEADLIVTGTQQHMVVGFVARCYDLRKPKIILMVHRNGKLPDRDWHDLSEGKAVLIPVDVENYDIEAVCNRIRHELKKCRTLHLPALNNSSHEYNQTAIMTTQFLQQASKQTSNDRLKVAVVCWDLSHNAAGRAVILADMLKENYEVELLGPLFGPAKRVWPPVRDFGIPLHSFLAPSFKDFIVGAVDLATTHRYDYVYASKARFPSVFLGMLIKLYSQCPLIVDLDELESTFFQLSIDENSNHSVLHDTSPEKWQSPPTLLWTLFAEELISSCDGLTVSNPALQERYGGTVVRHARNEVKFDPVQYNRCSVRAEFGYAELDKVVLFFGTARTHKGLVQVAKALDQIADPNLALCVVGEIDSPQLRALKEFHNVRINVHGFQQWERIPEVLSMADLVCLIQDPLSPISQFQIPAKLTDALAMDIPVLVSDVPPLRDILASNCVAVTTEESLAADIRRILCTVDPNSGRRELFLTEFTYAVNRPRIESVLRSSKMQALPLDFIQVMDIIECELGVRIPKGATFSPS